MGLNASLQWRAKDDKNVVAIWDAGISAFIRSSTVVVRKFPNVRCGRFSLVCVPGVCMYGLQRHPA